MDIIINNYLTIYSIIAIIAIFATLIAAIAKKTMITYGLIFANFFVFVLSLVFRGEILGSGALIEQSKITIDIAGLGFRPIYLTPEFAHYSYTIFTSMFVHADFIHIIGNMLIFFFMGIAFEQRIGWKKFFTIYLLTGFCAALTQAIINTMSPGMLPADASEGLQILMNNGAIPMVGASGAVFGIIGAFAFSYPRDEVVLPVPMGIVIIMKIKVIYAVILIVVIQTIYFLVLNSDFTAHYAHFGGLLSGFILAAILIRKKTHTKEGKTIYFEQYQESELQELDFTSLEKLAYTPKLREILDRIKAETVPQVQNIWLGHFLEKTNCPQCQSRLKHAGGKILCSKCDFQINYLQKK